jgi:Uma2 family endonuclease
MVVSTTRLVTVEELLAMTAGESFELVAGELAPVAPTGFEHGWIQVNVARRLFAAVESGEQDVVSEVGYVLRRNPDTVRGPDLSVRQVHVHESGGQKQVLGPDDLLDGGNVLAGFSVHVADLFPPPRAGAPT